MTEREELPFLDGLGDVMMMNNNLSVLYGGDTHDEDSEGLSFNTNAQDNPTSLDWNMDNMTGYDSENLSELFANDLFSEAFEEGTPNLESLLGDSLSKLDDEDTASTPSSFDFPPSDTAGFMSPNRGTKRQISGEEASHNSDAAIFEDFLAENNNVFKQCRGNSVGAGVVAPVTSGQQDGSALFDTLIPTISLPEFVSPKKEVETGLLTPTVTSNPPTVGGIAGVSTFGGLVVCKNEAVASPPPYSSTSQFWGSGLSLGGNSPTGGSNLEQQLSPLSDYTDSSSPSSSLSSGGSPDYQLSLNSPPGHSSTSGYSSSSSPSSSPPTRGSSRSPPSAARGSRAPPSSASSSSPPAVQTSGVKFTLNNNIAAGSTASTVTPQFYIQKKTTGNKFTINNNINYNSNNSKGQQITLVSTNQTQSSYPPTITTRVTNSTRISPTIINRNQLTSNNTTTTNNNTYNRTIGSNNTNTNTIGKPLLNGFKSSPAPSIVTLSGVNKTAGIIKSPSMVNLNRKQTFTTSNPSSTSNTVISSSNSLATSNTTTNNQQKMFSLVASSGDVIASSASSSSSSSTSSSSSSSPVYKAVTVTSANGRLTGSSGQQFIITPRGAVSGLAAGKFIKSSQNNSIYIPIKTRDLDKVRTIKLITKSSSQASGISTATKPGTPTFTTSSAGSTVLRASSASNGILVAGRNRTFTTSGISTSHSGTIRTTTPAGQVSILKNLCLGGKASLTSSSSGGYTNLLTIPKEEDYDSDDEGIELPQNGSPLTLTDEEQKLAQKESLKFPSHYPLTKKQERDLKRIRRKIRNKISAQDSRKRKKEYMDKLEERVTASTRENDRLKVQVANLHETNKKLAEQLKKFQTMMNSQPAPTVTSNNSGHSNNNSSSRQHHPSTFLLMMLMSAALFVYPSVVPQVKPGTDLLTAVPHHKMPPAGNSRSLLEAAATKLQVCHDEAHEDELDLEIKPSIAALTDHDYTPPAKRLRYDFGGVTRDGYCMPLLDDHLPPAPPPTKKEGPPGGGGGDDDKGGVWRVDEKGGGGGKEKSFGGPVAKEKAGADDDPVLEEMEVDILEEDVKVESEISLHTSKPGDHFSSSPALEASVPSLKVDPDLASRFTKEVLDSVMSQLGGSGSHNWTLENDGDAKKNAAVVTAALDSLSQSLVVELAAAAAGRKRLREDIELE